ncbi:MAG: hypothetical protein AABY02_03080 [Nanoarchaeota archaeon]
MNKAFKFLAGIIVASFALVAFASLSSAYSYYYDDNSYDHTFYEKSSYNEAGHTYIRKEVTKNDGRETTSYTKVKNYDGSRPAYANDLNDYWHYGTPDYSTTRYYRDYSYDDSSRRVSYNTAYHPYLYNSNQYYNGDYWDWRYQPKVTYIYRYNTPRCISNIGCHW